MRDETPSTAVVLSADESVQVAREAATAAMARQPGFDIANLSEEEFEQGLERLRIRQKRMKRIYDTNLVPGVHYGNPDNAWSKPRLLKAGAEELANLCRLSPRLMGQPDVILTKEFCSVTIRMGLADSKGNFVGERHAHCNSMEKRFKKRGGAGFTWADARETMHDCYSMAEKRAFVASVLAATGLEGFLSNGETYNKALAAGQEDREAVARQGATKDEAKPMERAEMNELYKLALAAGISDRFQWGQFVEDTLGTRFVGVSDGPKLRAALSEMAGPKPAATEPVAKQEEPGRTYDDPAADIEDDAGDAREP